MLQIMICCHRSVKGMLCIIIQKYFPDSSEDSWKCIWFVIWDVCSNHCSTKAPEKKTLLLKKVTLSATVMFMLNSSTLPHCYMGTYI
jgi:hypothetical protein